MKVAIISGRVVKDARAITEVERPFTSFSVVVNEKTKEGMTATFFDCTTNGTGLAQYLTKGKAVEVMGNFKLRAFTDDYGKTRTTVAIQAQAVHFCPQEKAAETAAPPTQLSTFDNEVPF